MANGKVITGFSKPYAAIYNNADGVVTIPYMVSSD